MGISISPDPCSAPICTGRGVTPLRPMIDLESFRHVYLRRVIGTVAGAIGPDATARVAQSLALGTFGLNTHARRRAEARVAVALGAGCTPGRARSIVRGMYAHWGRFWAEALFVQRLLRETSWRQFVDMNADDVAILNESAASRRGCIFAAGYYGNPAVLVDTLGRLGRPIHVVVDFLAQPHLRTWQTQLYSRPHVRPIERRDAATAIPRVLGEGGSVLLIAEHERRKGRAVACDYLGSRIHAYPTIPRLSRAFDAPVAVVSCRRTGQGFQFKLSVRDVLEPSDMHDEAMAMQRVLGRLEAAALEDPEQYLWSVPIGVPLSQVPVRHEGKGVSHAHALAVGAEARGSLASAAYWNGNRIGVVPKNTSNSVGVAMAVSGGQMTAGGGSSGGN